jgi:hypothetical protein
MRCFGRCTKARIGDTNAGPDADAPRAVERLAPEKLVVTTRVEEHREVVAAVLGTHRHRDGEVAEVDLFRIGQLDELTHLTLGPRLDVEGGQANL